MTKQILFQKYGVDSIFENQSIECISLWKKREKFYHLDSCRKKGFDKIQNSFVFLKKENS